jgi:hypothetical protein
MPVNSVDPLHLEGWDHHSVWGYDEQTDLWFAQLWRNTDHRDDPPTFWLGFRPPAEWACQIVDDVRRRHRRRPGHRRARHGRQPIRPAPSGIAS